MMAAIEARKPRLFARLLMIRDYTGLYVDYEAEFPLVRWLCEPTLWAVDIGANTGVYTYAMARYAAAVIAFEPNPHRARLLRIRFARQIAVGGIIIENSAVSDRNGAAPLF